MENIVSPTTEVLSRNTHENTCYQQEIDQGIIKSVTHLKVITIDAQDDWSVGANIEKRDGTFKGHFHYAWNA